MKIFFSLATHISEEQQFKNEEHAAILFATGMVIYTESEKERWFDKR